jgi:hypothetical protein
MALPAAFQCLPIPILVLSSEKHVLLSNKAMTALLGVCPQCELLDKSYRPVTLENMHVTELGIEILQEELGTSMSCEVCYIPLKIKPC